MAPRARRSTSAPATTPTARPRRDVQRRPGRPRAATIGEEVIYDPEQPTYDSEAEQITSGNPDAIVIIDFPETFDKVGPALVRTGKWDPTTTFVTDGLDLGDLPKDAGHGCDRGPARHRAGHARQGRDPEGVRQAVHGRRAEGRRASDVRRSELRRRDPLLPGSRGRRLDRRPGHGRRVHDVSGPPGTSTPSSSCPRRSRRSRTARTSTTRAPPARSTWTRPATRPRRLRHLRVQGRRARRSIGEVPVDTGRGATAQ